jgi:hypothetical protein
MSEQDNNFYERFTIEFDKMPKLGVDFKTASTDELLRGMIKMMTGNGDPMHGLMAKVAAVHLRVEDIQADIGRQRARCNYVMRSSGLDDEGKPIPGLLGAHIGAHSISAHVNPNTTSNSNSNPNQSTTINVNASPAPAAVERARFGSGVTEFLMANWKPLTMILAFLSMFLFNFFSIRASTVQQEEAAARNAVAIRTINTQQQQAIDKLQATLATVSTGTQPKDNNGNHTRPDAGK